VDAIAHVVRCFDDPNVIHVDGSVDPKRDIEVVEAELIFKDLDTVERKLGEAQKKAKAGRSDSKTKPVSWNESGITCWEAALSGTSRFKEKRRKLWLRDLHLLTNKPVMYVCNVHEKDLLTENEYVRQVRLRRKRKGHAW